MPESAPASPRSSTVAVGELRFDVRTAGPPDGPPVLLLHGFPQTSLAWVPTMVRLAAAGHHCVAPDQRGYSPGARPAQVAAYETDLIVGDAVGLLDALGLDRVDVVGHDWGAMVGWLLAATHPERVRTLTAVSVPHPAAYGAASRDDPEQQRRGAYVKLFLQEGTAEDTLLAGDGQWLRAAYGSAVPAADVAEYVARFGERDMLTATLNWYRASFGRRGRRPEPEVTVPTTYVYSDGDAFVAPGTAARAADFVTADYRYVELPGISHWIPDEAPDALVAAIRDRIARP